MVLVRYGVSAVCESQFVVFCLGFLSRNEETVGAPGNETLVEEI